MRRRSLFGALFGLARADRAVSAIRQLRQERKAQLLAEAHQIEATQDADTLAQALGACRHDRRSVLGSVVVAAAQGRSTVTV